MAAGLDATGGLTQASAERGTRAWQVARDLDPGAVDGPRSWLRIFLLVVQGLAIVWVAGPVRTDRESEAHMTDPSDQPTPGRRVASVVARGPDITVVLAVLLPLLTAGTLLLVRPDVRRTPRPSRPSSRP